MTEAQKTLPITNEDIFELLRDIQEQQSDILAGVRYVADIAKELKEFLSTVAPLAQTLANNPMLSSMMSLGKLG